ncbi:MAG: hypothetical protein K0S54_3248, partial [Alphaproteobacteria bacterium]|nr:hypothetical protein [Alphaproteobacteria bacterium]
MADILRVVRMRNDNANFSKWGVT